MTAHALALSVEPLQSVVDRVVERVMPAWPLDRAIATNPLWGFVERPRQSVLRDLSAWAGTRAALPHGWYHKALEQGRFGDTHLAEAITRLGLALAPSTVRARLAREEEAPAARQRVTDALDQALGPFRDRTCGETVVNAIGRTCLAWLEAGEESLYATWHRTAPHDPGPALALGLPGLRRALADLPVDPREAIASALFALDVDSEDVEPYLVGLLATVNGWASACAWRRWTARQEGRDNPAVIELLAVRLGWEVTLLQAGGPRAEAAWQQARAGWPDADLAVARHAEAALVAHEALELAAHRALARRLARPTEASGPGAFQVVCCIDVRSEVLRRAIEAADDGARTLGFAGFFGLPAEYVPVGAARGRPQLPGPLAPQVRLASEGHDGLGTRRVERLSLRAAWTRFAKDALAAFTFVDAVGLAFAPRLLTDAFGLTRPAPRADHAGLTDSERATCRPRLVGDQAGAPLDLEARADLAERILRGASLHRDAAPLVALIAHASSSTNNPFAAALDCGACCGHSGEVNARAAAALLNEPAVRDALARRGLDLQGVHFVAGLHDTTTDEVQLLDADLVPASHAALLARMRTALGVAGEQTRRERAEALGLLPDGDLRSRVQARGKDWGQPRPEWGLAGNMAMVIAPRSRTRGLDLGGRVFLHEYRAEHDPNGSVLTTLLTAPMVVAHWINFQYFASSVDPLRWGSGDKLLHDVVAGGIGVFEGDGGDLRVGLPLQSVHDGTRLRHEPIALGVFVEAPASAIDAVLAAHPSVRNLVEGGWIHLHRIDSQGTVEARVGGRWQVAARA